MSSANVHVRELIAWGFDEYPYRSSAIGLKQGDFVNQTVSAQIEEPGATEPWFFGDEQLFSDRPPRITDFLDDGLVLHYERTALHKVIRIRIEESLNEIDRIQGEKI